MNKVKEFPLINAVENSLNEFYGIAGKRLKKKVIVQHKCIYHLKNGGHITLKYKGNRLTSIKAKNCDEKEIKEFIEKIEKILDK